MTLVRLVGRLRSNPSFALSRLRNFHSTPPAPSRRRNHHDDDEDEKWARSMRTDKEKHDSPAERLKRQREQEKQQAERQAREKEEERKRVLAEREEERKRILAEKEEERRREEEDRKRKRHEEEEDRRRQWREENQARLDEERRLRAEKRKKEAEEQRKKEMEDEERKRRQARIERTATERVASIKAKCEASDGDIQGWKYQVGRIRAAVHGRHDSQTAAWSRIFHTLRIEVQYGQSLIDAHGPDVVEKAVALEKQAKARRAELRKTQGDWKIYCHDVKTAIFTYSTEFQAVRIHAGVRAEWHAKRLAEASSATQEEMEDLERQWQTAKRWQDYWAVEYEKWWQHSRELAAAIHALNAVLEWTLHPRVKFDPKQLSARMTAYHAYSRLIRQFEEAETELKQLLNRARVRIRTANTVPRKMAAQSWKSKVSRVVDCAVSHKLVIRDLGILMERLVPAFRMTSILRHADLDHLRTFRIMHMIEATSRLITNAKGTFKEYEDHIRDAGLDRGGSRLSHTRKMMSIAMTRHNVHWTNEIRFSVKSELEVVVERLSKWVVENQPIRREPLHHYVLQQLKELWKPQSAFDVFIPQVERVSALCTLIRLYPEENMDRGAQVIPHLYARARAERLGISQAHRKYMEAVVKEKRYRMALDWVREKHRKWIEAHPPPPSTSEEAKVELVTSDGPSEDAGHIEPEHDAPMKPPWLQEASLLRPPRFILDKSLVTGEYFPFLAYRYHAQTLRIKYWRTPQDGSSAICRLLGKVIGFDMEWNRNATPEDGPKANAPLIMLADNASTNLLHIALYDAIPEELVLLLESPDVIKVGVDVEEKCHRLHSFLGIKPQGFCELRDMHYQLKEKTQARRIKVKSQLSLDQLTSAHLGYHTPPSAYADGYDFTTRLWTHHANPGLSLFNRVYACGALGRTLYEMLHPDELPAQKSAKVGTPRAGVVTLSRRPLASRRRESFPARNTTGPRSPPVERPGKLLKEGSSTRRPITRQARPEQPHQGAVSSSSSFRQSSTPKTWKPPPNEDADEAEIASWQRWKIGLKDGKLKPYREGTWLSGRNSWKGKPQPREEARGEEEVGEVVSSSSSSAAAAAAAAAGSSSQFRRSLGPRLEEDDKDVASFYQSVIKSGKVSAAKDGASGSGSFLNGDGQSGKRGGSS